MSRFYQSDFFKLFIISIFGFGLNYIFNIFLSHNLDAASYGDISFAIQLVLFVGIFFVFGKNKLVILFVSQYRNSNDAIKEHDFITWCARSLLKSIALLLLCCVILIILSIVIKSISFFHLNKVHVAIWMLPVTSIYIVLYVIVSFYMVNSLAITSRVIRSNLSPLFFLCAMFLLAVFFPRFTVYSGVLGYYIGFLLLVFIAVFFFIAKRPYNKLFNYKYSNKEPSKEELAAWHKGANKFFQGSLYYGVLLFIGYFVMETVSLIPGANVSEADVGNLAAIYAIIFIITAVDNNIFKSVIPHIVHLYTTQSNKMKLESMVSIPTRINIGFSFAVLLVTILLGKFILSMFSSLYVDSYLPLIIFTLSNFAFTCSGLSPTLLSYLKLQGCSNFINIISCIAYLILGFLFSYFYGLLGLSIASLIAWSLRSLLLYIFAKNLTGLKPLGFI